MIVAITYLTLQFIYALILVHRTTTPLVFVSLSCFFVSVRVRYPSCAKFGSLMPLIVCTLNTDINRHGRYLEVDVSGLLRTMEQIHQPHVTLYYPELK
jgi:hypothetical protein